MRHSPTAYKYLRLSVRQFLRPKTYSTHGLVEISTNVQSANAFGLKIVERSAFFADKRIPRKVKLNMRAQAGGWVIYLPNHERTTLFVGDSPSELCRLAVGHMQSISKEA